MLMRRWPDPRNHNDNGVDDGDDVDYGVDDGHDQGEPDPHNHTSEEERQKAAARASAPRVGLR